MKDWKNSLTIKVHFIMIAKVMIGIIMMRVIMKNEQQQLSEGFANSCYKIISPVLLQALTNDFAIYKHCITTPSLVKDVTSSHDFGN